MQVPNSLTGYAPPSVVETSPANPVAPASTSAYKMQGLAALFTPGTSAANVLAIVQATILSAVVTADNGINVQLWYGPVISGVAPPANAAAIPASAIQLGTTKTVTSGTTLTSAADLQVPISIAGLAKGLVQGQQYWFDIAAESVGTASDYSLTNTDVLLVEIS